MTAVAVTGCQAAASLADPTPVPSSPAPSPAPSASPPSCADQVLATMTEPQRIGQLFLVGIDENRPATLATDLALIAERHLGSVWYTTRTTVDVAAIRALSDRVQALSTRAATDGVGFLIAANQEGGRIQALAGPGFDVIPSALGQGALDPAHLEGLAETWGRELRAAGVDLDFAPVADVVPPGTDADNAPIGQLDRGYGHTPTVVASHVVAFIAGMRAAGVATTVKHFPGLGRVTANTDLAAGVVDDTTTADDPFLEPFGAAVRASVPFVMVSLATYSRIDPARIAAFSPAIVDGLLRSDLGFGGVVMSDSLSATAVTSLTPGERAIRFLEAGGDLIVVDGPSIASLMADALAARVSDDATFGALVDAAALRVLEAKAGLGLLPCR